MPRLAESGQWIGPTRRRATDDGKERQWSFFPELAGLDFLRSNPFLEQPTNESSIWGNLGGHPFGWGASGGGWEGSGETSRKGEEKAEMDGGKRLEKRKKAQGFWSLGLICQPTALQKLTQRREARKGQRRGRKRVKGGRVTARVAPPSPNP